MIDTGIKDFPLVLTVPGIFSRVKMDESFADIRHHMLGIANDILIVGFQNDGSDHDQVLEAVMKQAYSILWRNSYLLWCEVYSYEN